MTWIFESCPDEYGSCIRQDILFGLSIIALLFATFSCFKVYRHENQLTFQILPLSINALTSLILVGIYTQMQVFNIRISLLIVELYTYFILTYGFMYMVAKRSVDQFNNLKKIRILFAILTIVCLLGFISIIVISILGIVTCNQDQGIGSIVLIALQIPLFLVTYIYSNKSKTILIHQDQNIEDSRTQQNQSLLSQGTAFKKVKLLQLKYIRLTFLITVVLHIAQIIQYYIGNMDQQLVCTNNQIKVSNPTIFSLLLIENITQLIPHFMIPIIFWQLPSRLVKQAVSLYLSKEVNHQRNVGQNNLKLKRQESKLVGDVQNEQKIRRKMNENVPKRLERTSTI